MFSIDTAYLSYTSRFAVIIPQAWPSRVILLVLWPSYHTHGLLKLCSSFCGHHTLHMASSSYAPRFVAIIPQTWPPRVMLLVLWPPYLKHGLLELCSSCCGHHTSNMASSSYTPHLMTIIPQTWPSRVILLVLWAPYLKHDLFELYLFKIEHQKCSKKKRNELLLDRITCSVCLIHVVCYRFFHHF